ncbi:MAG TPA: hypothetical protein VJ417_02065 [Candidatus Glassbacteria bacterium]|nr:hypothetical protein [Candidatus Glassbacteria bacterium]
MLAESTELARQAGQPENLMHSLKSLIDWKLQFEKQTDSVKNDIRLFIQELENIARKVSSKQFISFCGEMKKKLGI